MSRKYKFANPEGVYFVSFATVQWVDVFTRRCYKDILVESINYCVDNKGLKIYAWVIMSNHVHCLIQKTEESLEYILRDLKKFSSKAILKEIDENQQESRKSWMLWIFERAGEKNSNDSHYQFWQQQNQPVELTTTQEIEQKIDYIHNNPVMAGFVNNPEDYPYSSAVDFAGGEGLVKLEPM